ncbi:hypothetical protein FHW37_10913 [Neorhizobium alkalisoli]|uniref:Uncharacterized protein n=1 Tax=Neorhizobium alkalisoli TaxID=528178 RepID=A0A561QC47_9HYPH|nr:hypothetical protein FHW37_10913 [Neorhizobium alkalisoli]
MIPLGKLWAELCQLPPRWQMPGRQFPKITDIFRCSRAVTRVLVETSMYVETLYSAESVMVIPTNASSDSKVTGCYNPAAADAPILVSVSSILQSAT